VTCTIVNTDNTPTLKLVKNVTNDNGGTKTAADWTLSATAASPNAGRNFSSTTATPTFHDIFGGVQYTLSESAAPAGYTNGTTWDCDGGSFVSPNKITVPLGAHVTCSITNDDQPGKIVIIKNAKPANGVFTFTTTGSTSGPGTSWPSPSFTLTGSTSGGGNTKTFTVDAGSYTVKESTQLGWTLTGIGGSSDLNTPYNCVVTGTNGSTGVGDLNTQTATITVKVGDTVTCTFENTGNGATRTQGFWATHSPLAQIAWFGGTAFGHTFPGVAATLPSPNNNTTLCSPVTKDINSLSRLMGGFWSDVSKKTTGAKRSALDQARMQLLQQLLAAELNASAFGSVPPGGLSVFATWESAYCGTNQTAIKNALQGAASFNNSGDSSTFTPGTSADSKNARAIADRVFWDVLP
jgi:hypothetical protein